MEESGSTLTNHRLQLATICKEFQKYTGNETIITCSLQSQYTEDFHIHPQLLANNFFERRKQFYRKLKTVILSIPSKEQLLSYLNDAEISYMLHHFGIQNVIKELKKYDDTDNGSITIIGSDDESDTDTSSDDDDKQHNTTNTVYSHRRKKKKRIQRVTYKAFIFRLLINLHPSKKKKYQTSKDQFIDCQNMISMGLVMNDYSSNLYNLLSDCSLSELQKTLKCNSKPLLNTVNKNGVISLCQQLQSWSKYGINGIQKIANDYREKSLCLLRKHFFNYKTCNVCHHRNKFKENYGAKIMGKQLVSSSRISTNHDFAKVIGVIKICINNDLETRCTEINNLSVRCVRNKEPTIALKMLKYSYKLSNSYLEIKYWDQERYESVMDSIKLYWLTVQCKNCNAISNGIMKHKICTGCMKVAYCNRKCQKRDWNKNHKYVCNKTWLSLYNALKMTLFDRFL